MPNRCRGPDRFAASCCGSDSSPLREQCRAQGPRLLERGERHLTVNLFGTYEVTGPFLPLLLASKGAIVNNLSTDSLAPFPPIASSSVSKAAALSLTRSPRALPAERGVRVHAVLTGPVDTEMSRGLDAPKACTGSVARAVFEEVEKGEGDIFPIPRPGRRPQAEVAWRRPWSCSRRVPGDMTRRFLSCPAIRPRYRQRDVSVATDRAPGHTGRSPASRSVSARRPLAAAVSRASGVLATRPGK